MWRTSPILLLLTAVAQAQPPPTVTTPPPWIPYYAVPGPSPEQIRALEHSGHHNEKIGAILMATGGALAVAGTAMWIAGDWHNDCWDHHDGDHHDGDHHDGHHDGCDTSALSIAGATTTFVGTAALVPGIVLYVHGASEVRHARRLQRQYWGPLTLRPTLSRYGGGFSLEMSH
jgi:hypothetical protein